MLTGIATVTELERIDVELDRAGVPQAACASLLEKVTEDAGTQDPVRRLAGKIHPGGPDDAFERALILRAARENWAGIDALRVVDEVKAGLRRELSALAKHRPGFPINVGTYNFVIASKMATLRRFPCGPLDWEISGIPLSWAPHVSARCLIELLWYMTFKMHGRRPLFFMHVAPAPRSRALVLEKEIYKSWHRMAASLAMQPEMRGIAANAWFLDPAAVKAQPHLECLNAPFTKLGGYLCTAGPAKADSGVLERNPDRARKFLSGDLRYRMGVGLWSREAATSWAQEHPEFGAQ